MAGDPYNLERFLSAQERDYERANSEIRAGRKRTHWMWYVFPQLDGLGLSGTARRLAIKSLPEAKAYLRHRVLGPRLLESMEAALSVEGRTAHKIFGSPDDMKLRSCATLFGHVSLRGSVFHRVIDKYFEGEQDLLTLSLLNELTPGD